MSLIKCTECGKEFSDKAAACPNCACPTEDILKEINKQVVTSAGKNGQAIEVGDIVLFGRYPQAKALAVSNIACNKLYKQIDDKLWRASDGTEYYGVLADDKDTMNLFCVEPLQWKVIKKTGSECLLLSEKILRFLPFDLHKNIPYEVNPFEDFSRRCFLKYMQSSIRKELTESFYNEAFSEQEKAAIFPALFTSGGSSIPAMRESDHKDVVFLPSSEELLSNLGWYPTKAATEYAQYSAPMFGNFNSWLTRTMRKPDEWGDVLEMVAQSCSGGETKINRTGFTTCTGVVPALWVDAAAINRMDEGLFQIKAEQSDVPEHISVLVAAAERGDSNAQIQLGLLYEEGNGVVQDIEKANYWLKKAAKQGNQRAIVDCLFRGLI